MNIMSEMKMESTDIKKITEDGEMAGQVLVQDLKNKYVACSSPVLKASRGRGRSFSIKPGNSSVEQQLQDHAATNSSLACCNAPVNLLYLTIKREESSVTCGSSSDISSSAGLTTAVELSHEQFVPQGDTVDSSLPKHQDTSELPDLLKCQVAPEEQLCDENRPEKINTNIHDESTPGISHSSLLDPSRHKIIPTKEQAAEGGAAVNIPKVETSHNFSVKEDSKADEEVSAHSPRSGKGARQNICPDFSKAAYSRGGRVQKSTLFLKSVEDLSKSKILYERPAIANQDETYRESGRQFKVSKQTHVSGNKNAECSSRIRNRNAGCDQKCRNNRYFAGCDQKSRNNRYFAPQQSHQFSKHSRRNKKSFVLLNREPFGPQVHVSGKGDVEKKPNQKSKLVTFRGDYCSQNYQEAAKNDNSQVNSHAEQTNKAAQEMTTVHLEKVCENTDPKLQEKTEVTETSEILGLTNQLLDLKVHNISNRNTTGQMSGEMLNTQNEDMGYDPSVQKMIKAIYQSYERDAENCNQKTGTVAKRGKDKESKVEVTSWKDTHGKDNQKNVEELIPNITCAHSAENTAGLHGQSLASTQDTRTITCGESVLQVVKDSEIAESSQPGGHSVTDVRAKTGIVKDSKISESNNADEHCVCDVRPQCQNDIEELQLKTSVFKMLGDNQLLSSALGSKTCHQQRQYAQSGHTSDDHSASSSDYEASLYSQSESEQKSLPEDMPERQNHSSSDSYETYPSCDPLGVSRLHSASGSSPQTEPFNEIHGSGRDSSFSKPCFKTRKCILPAQAVGTQQAMDRMIAFLESCSTDVEKHMSRWNINDPIDVTIIFSLTPSSLLDVEPPLSRDHSTIRNQREEPPVMLPHSLSVPPPPPYSFWQPWPEWYSPSMGTSVSDVPFSHPCYPGWMHHFPQNSGSDSKKSASGRVAPSYLSPWMYSYWNCLPHYYKEWEQSQVYAYSSHPPPAVREKMAAGFKSRSCVGNNDISGPDVQTLARGTTGNGEESGDASERAREPVKLSRNRKHSQPDVNSHLGTRINGSAENAWKKMSKQREYMRRMSVSSFLSKERLRNDWRSGTCSAPAVNLSRKTVDNVKSSAIPMHLDSGMASPLETVTCSNPLSQDLAGHQKWGKWPPCVSGATESAVVKNRNSDIFRLKETAVPLDDVQQPAQAKNTVAWLRRSEPCHQTQENEQHQNLPQVKTIQSFFQGWSQSSERAQLSSQMLCSLERVEENGMLVPQSPHSATHAKKAHVSREWAKQFVARSQRYQYTFVDCHCHIDFLYSRLDMKKPTSFATFREAHADLFPHNYEGCVAVFCNPHTFAAENPKDQVLRAVCNEDGIWLAMGCHPKNATEFSDSHLARLRQILKHPKVVALGEIGLDYSGTFSQHSEKQKQVFIQQLHLALEMKLPLVIHCRDADDDCLEILTKTVPADHKIHAHCFTRDMTVAMRWMTPFPNLFLGLTPVISYKSALEAANAATYIPLNRLLLETDAPYFVPSKIITSYSHPGFALFTAEKVAELKNIPVDEVLKACRENTRKMYGI